ncbi:MAG: glycosyltransferase family 4 protein [Oscillospiraceae bacterium]
MKKVCMVVQDKKVKGGIAAVVNGYRGSQLEKDYKIIYVESYKDGGRITKLFKALKGYLHFVKVLMVDKPELVHIHSSFGPSFYRKMPFVYMASWAKKPIVNHIHGADIDKFYLDADDKKKKLIKKVYNKCTVLIALSEEWKGRLGMIVPPEKIEIIENYSVLHEDALIERQKRNCNNIVLFLGELGRRKGCYDIPAVVQKVKEKVPDVMFLLCGAGSREDESEIRKLIEDYGVSDNVKFPGWVRDKKKDDVLRKADIFYLPSYNEGMPMSVLDAMGYGLPVVSTNVGGIPKIVHDGENGTCCEAGDVDAMAKGITMLLINKDVREKAARESMSIVKNNYSLDKHLALLEKIYERF